MSSVLERCFSPLEFTESGVGCAEHDDPTCLCDVVVTDPVDVRYGFDRVVFGKMACDALGDAPEDPASVVEWASWALAAHDVAHSWWEFLVDDDGPDDVAVPLTPAEWDSLPLEHRRRLRNSGQRRSPKEQRERLRLWRGWLRTSTVEAAAAAVGMTVEAAFAAFESRDAPDFRGFGTPLAEKMDWRTFMAFHDACKNRIALGMSYADLGEKFFGERSHSTKMQAAYFVRRCGFQTK